MTTCGHHSLFFSEVAAAQGILVDTVQIRIAQADAQTRGYAMDIAVGVQDVDGDWREPGWDPGAPPDDQGHKLWWFNSPLGPVPYGKTLHAACRYQDGTEVTIYDPSFGQRYVGSWEKYVASTVTRYSIHLPEEPLPWYTKDEVINRGYTVKWYKRLNLGPNEDAVVWPPFA